MSRVVDAKLEMVIERDKLLAYIKTGQKVIDEETLADRIHSVFCESRGFGYWGMSSLQADIHHRQHIEIAKAILDGIPAQEGLI